MAKLCKYVKKHVILNSLHISDMETTVILDSEYSEKKQKINPAIREWYDPSPSLMDRPERIYQGEPEI